MALSCEKAIETEVSATESNLKTYTAVFATPNQNSKVSLEQSGKTEWKVGDVITIHGKKTSENKTVTLDGVTNTISADGKVATFTVALDMEADDYGSDGYYAQYPNSAYAEYESDRARYFNCFNNTNTLLLSGVYDATHERFVFYNVTGALSFTIDGDSFGGFDEYMVVGKDDEVIGYSQYNTRVATGAFTFCHYSSIGAKKSIRGSIEDDGTTVNYVYFPVTEELDTADEAGSRAECVDFEKGFIIYLLKGGVITHMVSTSNDVRIERQSLLRLGDITSHVKTYSAPGSHAAKHPAITGAEDLGATSAGTSNSYIVRADVDGNANKVFKFKAVKGNSSTNVGAINSVEVLWETYNNATSVTSNSVIAQADFEKDGEKDYYEICFKMPGTLKAGNALLAAKDIYDNILWSWHIWVPATEVQSGDYGISTSNIMDRNMGALRISVAQATYTDFDIQSAGLLYQWGRKDPFFGNRAMNSRDKAKGAGEIPANHTGQMTIAETIAHPNLVAVYKGDWNPSSDADLWGNTSEAKTIYDPCPPGYRVPRRSEVDFMSSTPKTSGEGAWTIGGNYTYHDDDKDVDIEYYTWIRLNGATTILPNIVLIDYDGRYSRVGRSMYWSATPKADAAYGYGRYFFEASEGYMDSSKRKSICGNVRCVVQ